MNNKKNRNYALENRRRSIRNKTIRAQNKELKKQEMMSGHRTSRRLSFLRDILDAVGLNWKQLAERGGVITPQSLNWWWVTDDCGLKVLQKVLRAVNIEIQPHFRGWEESERKIDTSQLRMDYHYTLEGNLFPAGRNETPKPKTLLSLIQSVSNSTCRLSFLAIYLNERLATNTIQEILVEMDSTYESLRTNFLNDDIKISKLYQLAERNGLTIVWEVNKKEG